MAVGCGRGKGGGGWFGGRIVMPGIEVKRGRVEPG